MSQHTIKTSFANLTGIVLSVSLLLGGCASKAKLLQTGAAQFETESKAAIEKIDELRRKEIEATPLSSKEASEQFVKLVTGSSKPITLETVKILLDPFKAHAPESEAEWQAFLQKMRRQYMMFATTFASLDTGSLFAADDVKDAVPILDKLIAQMAAFSQGIKENPATFIRERAVIAMELEEVRDSDSPDEVKKLELLELERRLREIAAAEEDMTRRTVEQTVKAAKLGMELRQLLMNYDELSVDDIAEGLTTAFRLVGGIPGLDLSGLQAETNEILQEINKDETLKQLFNLALSEVPSLSERTEGR